MNFDLTETERAALEAFLKTRSAKRLLRDGGRFALVYGPSTGIGVPVTVTVQSRTGEVLSVNITDYASW